MADVLPEVPSGESVESKRSWFWAVWVGAGVFVVLVTVGYLWLAATAVNAAQPKAVVGQYLSDLVHGKAEAALKLTGSKPIAYEVLLTDAAYAQATGRIGHYRVTSSTVKGSVAHVTASITQGDHKYSETFTLYLSGTRALVLQAWRLGAVPLTQIAVQVEGPDGILLKVSGQKAAPYHGLLTLHALPGTYKAQLAEDSKWFSITPVTLTAVGFGSAEPSPVNLPVVLSAAGKQAAVDAVKSFIDDCVASTVPIVPNCPFYVFAEDPSLTLSNVRWTLDSQPVVNVGEWKDGGWAVVTTTPGAVEATVHGQTADGRSGELTTSQIPVIPLGLITQFDDSGATFLSLVSNDGSQQG